MRERKNSYQSVHAHLSDDEIRDAEPADQEQIRLSFSFHGIHAGRKRDHDKKISG